MSRVRGQAPPSKHEPSHLTSGSHTCTPSCEARSPSNPRSCSNSGRVAPTNIAPCRVGWHPQAGALRRTRIIRQRRCVRSLPAGDACGTPGIHGSAERGHPLPAPPRPQRVPGCLISQSGQTKEIVETQNWAKACGAVTVAISNVEDSPLTQGADLALVTRAGPERAVPINQDLHDPTCRSCSPSHCPRA